MRFLFKICGVQLAVCLCASGITGVAAQAAGEGPITLEMNDADITAALREVASKAGMNIVIGNGVRGKTTLFVRDVEPEAAFELILMSNDLACERRGGIYRVFTQREYEALHGERYNSGLERATVKLKYASARSLAEQLLQIKSPQGRVIADNLSNVLMIIDDRPRLDQMLEYLRQADVPGTETRVFSLRFARAAKLAPKLQDRLTSGCGSLRVDEESNKIAVTDYPRRLTEIAALVSAFDEKPRQVLIDAQIIEISPEEKFEMGVDWDYWINKHFRVSGQLPLGAADRLLIGTPQITPQEPGQYKAVIDMLRTVGRVRILSSPRIMVLNNEEAKIMVGTKDAYITSSISVLESDDSISAQSVNFIDVGIKLFVTPFVNGDGCVRMRIHPEVSSSRREDIISEGKVTQVPVVSTSETETTVMLKDGVTLLIAGLNREEESSTLRKIPLLGDIPFLGALFRSTSREHIRKELVVLLTPHLVDNGISSAARGIKGFDSRFTLTVPLPARIPAGKARKAGQKT
ncbi:MAG: type II secretion system protein GspD [Elusimicrobia bacterium]|nr:type II secretion system protein GspD [Elusimicrobiota bacterium]